jgi:hypothetical protein
MKGSTELKGGRARQLGERVGRSSNVGRCRPNAWTLRYTAIVLLRGADGSRGCKGSAMLGGSCLCVKLSGYSALMLETSRQRYMRSQRRGEFENNRLSSLVFYD